MASTKIKIAVAAVIGIGAIAFGVSRFGPKTKSQETPVGRIMTAKTGDLAVQVTETGTLEPVSKVDVKSRVAGRLLKIYVKPGMFVRAGDPIAVVDPTEVSREVAGIRSQLDSSEAQVASATQNLELTRIQNTLSIRRAEVALKNALVGQREAEVNLRDARVGVVQAQKRLALASAPTRSQELQQSKQSVRRLEAQIVDLKRIADRRQALATKGFVSQQEADSAQTQVSLTETDLESAKERVKLLEEGPRVEDIDSTKVGIDSADVRVAQAQVRIDQAKVAVETARLQLATERANRAQVLLRQRDLERARADAAQVRNRLAQQSVQLQETRIVAPIAGDITGRYIEEGELVASATAGFAQGVALVTIADLSRMQVKVNVNEVDVARLSVGQEVKIRVDGVPGKAFVGRVASIAPASLTSTQPGSSSSSSAASSNAVVRFEVKIAVDNTARKLRPGMTAGVDIQIASRKNVVVVPSEVLTDSGEVTVVTGDGEKQIRTKRSVKIGLKNDSQTEILSGLSAGDRVEVPKIDAKDRRTIDIGGPN